jgi:hypothetical protein
MWTWEDRFTQQEKKAEKRVQMALEAGDVTSAKKIARRVHNRAKTTGFVSCLVVSLQLKYLHQEMLFVVDGLFKL